MIEWKKVKRKPIIMRAYQTSVTKQITTLEGVMQADEGDWIVEGIVGELWPVKPDIFAKTYEIIGD